MEKEQMLERIEFLHGRVELLDKRLKCIQTIAAALGSSLNLQEVLHTVAEQATALLDAQRSTVFLVDDDSGNLKAHVIIGPELKELSLKQGQGIAGWVARTGKTLNVKDAYKDRRFDPGVDQISGFKTECILCQPMVTYKGRIVGVIQVLNKNGGYFTMEDEHLLSTITTQATISIENSKYLGQVQDANYRLREAQESLQKNYQRLETLYRIQSEIGQTWDVKALVGGVMKQLLETIPSEASALLLQLPFPSKVFVQRLGSEAVGVVDPAVRGGILGAVVDTGQAVVDGVLPAGTAPILHPQVDADVDTVIAEPLIGGDGEAFGSIGLVNRRKVPGFTREDSQLLRIVAREVSVAMERLKQHEDLTKANNLALIGQALSGVLHDLRSPMSVISGYVQLMEQENDPAQRGRFAMDVLKQFKLIGTMTQEVLAFARGESQVLKRNIYLQKFFEETVQFLKQEFSGKNIDLVLENRSKSKIKADEGKLGRLVFNLARNAREAMPGGGVFKIEADDDGDFVVLRFSDTGHGIPEEIRDRLFQSFVTSGKKDGTGLGLAIVKKIVDQHNGTITFESEKDKGTRFTIRLPKL